MSHELKPMVLGPSLQQGLPLGYQRIMVRDEIADEQTRRMLTFDLPKFHHSTRFSRGPGKPLSKPEL
jgi:hypothetical protein